METSAKACSGGLRPPCFLRFSAPPAVTDRRYNKNDIAEVSDEIDNRGVAGELSGMAWLINQVAVHRNHLEAGAKSRKLRMKKYAFSYLTLVGLSLCAVLNWSCRPNVSSPQLPPMNTVELRQTLEKCSSEPEIQAEVDSLLSRFGYKDSKPLYGAVLATTPGVTLFAKALSDDPLLDIVPSGYDEIGVPSHVRIRFGTHFHYQFILVFRTGSDLSSIKPPFEQVTNNVYFKP